MTSAGKYYSVLVISTLENKMALTLSQKEVAVSLYEQATAFQGVLTQALITLAALQIDSPENKDLAATATITEKQLAELNKYLSALKMKLETPSLKLV